MSFKPDENELQKVEEESMRQTEVTVCLLSLGETRSISSCIYAGQTAC